MALADHVEGIVHEPTQTEGPGLDLTVAEVHEVTAPGQVDFGGGDLAAAERRTLSPAKRDPDDDYGWWELAGGTYLLAYNESLTASAPRLRLEPRLAVVEHGASHPTVTVEEELPAVPLTVPEGGLDLKENARVSTLFDARES